MPIRCHAEHNGQGIVLSKLQSKSDVESLRHFFAEKIIRVHERTGLPDDYRLFMPGVSMEAFAFFIKNASIKLID